MLEAASLFEGQLHSYMDTAMNIMMQIVCLVLLVFSCAAVSGEKVTVCAKYQTTTGWSKSYQVQATILDGSELNSATNSYRYTSFSKYVVIFWDKDQASIIKLNSSFLSSLGASGVDQKGRQWEIANTSLCQSGGYPTFTTGLDRLHAARAAGLKDAQTRAATQQTLANAKLTQAQAELQRSNNELAFLENQIALQKLKQSQNQVDDSTSFPDTNSNKIDAYIQHELSVAKPLLPLMVDSETRLDAIEYYGDRVEYYYTAVNAGASQLDTERVRRKMIPELQRISCSEPFKLKVIKAGKSINYAYRGKYGDLITAILVDPSVCD